MLEQAPNPLPQCSRQSKDVVSKKETQDLLSGSLGSLPLDDNISKIINKYSAQSCNKEFHDNTVKLEKKMIKFEKNISREEATPSSSKTTGQGCPSNKQTNVSHELSSYKNSRHNKHTYNKSLSIIDEKPIERLDKATYCRPVTKYNPELHNIVQENNNLRGVVQKLSFRKQKQAEESMWDKYINTLKKKHLRRPDKRQSCSYVDEMIGSTARIKYHFRPRDHVQNLNKKYISCNSTIKIFQQKSLDSFYSMENFERTHKRFGYPVIRAPCKIFHVPRTGRKPKVLGSSFKSCSTQVTGDGKILLKKAVKAKTNTVFKNCVTQVNSVQTSRVNIFQPAHARHNKPDDINNDKKDVVVPNDQNQASTEKSFVTIENKIETLIQSMNNFINEMRLQRNNANNDKTDQGRKIANDAKPQTLLSPEDSLDFTFESFKNIVNYTQPPSAIVQNDRNLDHVASSDIFVNKYRANFDKINKKSSIQIKFEVPTRDGCTEITNSFSRQIPNFAYVNAIPTYTGQVEKTTVALNTEPISLVALLKISTEALRGLFSFDINSYLPYLQLPRLQWGDPRPCLCDRDANNVNVERDANRCFNTESYLSRLVPAGPFRCQHCDRLFDKACAWELHEFSCARTPGRFLKMAGQK